MSRCHELARDLYGESVNAGMTSTRGSAAFCRCGIGTGIRSVTLRAFLMFLQHLLHFSLCDSSHLIMSIVAQIYIP